MPKENSSLPKESRNILQQENVIPAEVAGVTAPTTVTQPPSTPTSSATASTRPPNVYIYEPLISGFDRYDFNSGKKVYTPDSGPSRNTSSQSAVQQSVPRTLPGANRDPGQPGPF